mgnify:FL=1
MLKSKKGIFIVISGPSGVGKGTIVKELLERFNAWYSISMTTRPKRENEIDKVNYFFVTKEQFEENIKEDGFIEYATYNNNYYGTPRKEIDNKLNNNIDVIAEIEVKGAKKVKELYKDSVLIYILPPSFEELETRLRNRNTEDNTTIEKRLNIAKEELKQIDIYDYVVVNNTVEETTNKVINIIESEKSKVSRNNIII